LNWEADDKDDKAEALLKNLVQLTTAIETCLQARLQIPTLILLYSSIDIMGYLDMPADKDSNTSADFLRWADTYLIPNMKDAICTSMDLYSARCGLLHSMSYESNLTRKRDAKNIMYTGGKLKGFDFKSVLRSLGKDDVVINIDDFCISFRKGLKEFIQEITADDKKLALMLERAKNMFVSTKTPPGPDNGAPYRVK
jgi:hypothetical protein